MESIRQEHTVNVANTPRLRRVWLIPASAVIAVVGIPSLLDDHPVVGRDTPALIQEVLANPLVNAIPALLPVAKLLLVVMAALPVVGVRHAPRLLVGYYAAVLVVVGVFQNAADLGSRGFAFLTGNAIAQLALAVCCLISLPTVRAECTPLRTGRVWVIPLAVLAAAFPYAVDGGRVVPSVEGMLTNAAGVTYCMVTAVVGAAILLRPDAYPGWLRVAVAALGTVFGLLNAVTWFLLAPQSWWMGVLHLPLLICSTFLLATSWTEAGGRAHLVQDTPHHVTRSARPHRPTEEGGHVAR